MKLPYELGRWYAMPLGDGTCARIGIARVAHHVVDLVVHAGDDKTPVASLRVSDRALVLHRWHRLDRDVPVERRDVENDAWITPARAERVVASRLGRLPFREESSVLQDLRDGDRPHGSMLTWRKPLDGPTLRAVMTYVEHRPRTLVRLYGAAMRQAGAFAATALKRLCVTAPIRDLRLESVEELQLEAAMPLDDALNCVPNLRSLRIAARGVDVAGAHLPRGLRVLDCSGVRSVDLESLPHLEALRLTHVESAVHLLGLPPHLRTLTLAYTRLEAIDILAGLPALEDLTLDGMWHLEIPHAQTLLASPGLRRVAIDIGGRRKNVELYKRARWAYPWPFGTSERFGTPAP